MTDEMPIRHFSVVQSKEEIVSRLDAARNAVSKANLDLISDSAGEGFEVAFSVRQAEHSPDGSHLYVGVSDLDVTVNIVIDPDGVVTARLDNPSF